jgi:hypothetical protein
MKRFKLNKYVSSHATKQTMGTLFSGSASDIFSSNATKLTDSGLYIAGWFGTISHNSTISADSYLYTEGLFDRRYSEENSDIVTNGVDLDVLPTASPIIDMIQFGDFAFDLTKETIDGTSYATRTTPEPSNWVTEKQQLVTYVPGDPGTIDKIITNFDFQLANDTYYGFLSGSDFSFFADPSGCLANEVNPTYSTSLPFSFLFEQPLNSSVIFQSMQIAYGSPLGGNDYIMYTPLPNLSHPPFYSTRLDDDDVNKIYFNPFKLKNMYNYNWNCEYNRSTLFLTGVRNYKKVGQTQNTVWLSYKYIRENSTIVQGFELVERIKGLFKYKTLANHKSNIFSLELRDSGLNESMEDGPIKDKMRELIQQSILKAVKKIAPASTQLWKIIYTGK